MRGEKKYAFVLCKNVFLGLSVCVVVSCKIDCGVGLRVVCGFKIVCGLVCEFVCGFGCKMLCGFAWEVGFGVLRKRFCQESLFGCSMFDCVAPDCGTPDFSVLDSSAQDSTTSAKTQKYLKIFIDSFFTSYYLIRYSYRFAIFIDGLFYAQKLHKSKSS